MSLFPEGSADHQKQEILQRAPFTRTFLDTQASTDNLAEWSNELKRQALQVHTEMTEKFSGKSDELTLIPLYIVADKLQIFDPDLSRQEIAAMIRNIIAMGYEIGNYHDAGLLIPDVLTAVLKDGFFNPKLKGHEAGKYEIYDYIESLLISGAYLKLSPEKKDDSRKTADTNNAFADFINTLDLEGL